MKLYSLCEIYYKFILTKFWFWKIGSFVSIFIKKILIIKDLSLKTYISKPSVPLASAARSK